MSTSTPVAPVMLPPLTVKAPVTELRLRPVAGLFVDESELKVTPPLKVVFATFTAGPPVALTVFVVPPMVIEPGELANRPVPALVVMASEAKLVLVLALLVASVTPVLLAPTLASAKENDADAGALVMLMPVAAPLMLVSVPALLVTDRLPPTVSR